MQFHSVRMLELRYMMQGEVESLDAAIACTILTYEAVRQRSV